MTVSAEQDWIAAHRSIGGEYRVGTSAVDWSMKRTVEGDGWRVTHWGQIFTPPERHQEIQP